MNSFPRSDRKIQGATSAQRKRSIWATRFAVFANKIANSVLFPNAPFMASPGLYPDSFPNTNPFQFSAATYFISMSGLLGSTVSALFVGKLSDIAGRRPCMLVNAVLTIFTTIVMYLLRHTFWGYCAASFANGLFGTSNILAVAHASDMLTTRAKKDAEIRLIMALYITALPVGGIFTIALQGTGLFTPLFIGSGLSFVSAVLSCIFMVESAPRLLAAQDQPPHDTVIQSIDEEPSGQGAQFDSIQEDAGYFNTSAIQTLNTPNPECLDEDLSTGERIHRRKKDEPPLALNLWLLSAVMFGTLLDNFGSNGLYPLVLSPLAFERYYLDFVETGEDPLISANGYRWVTVLVWFGILLGAVVAGYTAPRIGNARTFTLGTIFTACGIVGCLYIVKIDPPSKGTLAGFIVFLYAMVPFTVMSQLSSLPMVDALAPAVHRGVIDGVYGVVFNFSCAICPWMFGLLADHAGTDIALWTTVVICLAATAIGICFTRVPVLNIVTKARKENHLDEESRLHIRLEASSSAFLFRA